MIQSEVGRSGSTSGRVVKVLWGWRCRVSTWGAWGLVGRGWGGGMRREDVRSGDGGGTIVAVLYLAARSE